MPAQHQTPSTPLFSDEQRVKEIEREVKDIPWTHSQTHPACEYQKQKSTQIFARHNQLNARVPCGCNNSGICGPFSFFCNCNVICKTLLVQNKCKLCTFITLSHISNFPRYPAHFGIANTIVTDSHHRTPSSISTSRWIIIRKHISPSFDHPSSIHANRLLYGPHQKTSIKDPKLPHILTSCSRAIPEYSSIKIQIEILLDKLTKSSLSIRKIKIKKGGNWKKENKRKRGKWKEISKLSPCRPCKS